MISVPAPCRSLTDTDNRRDRRRSNAPRSVYVPIGNGHRWTQQYVSSAEASLRLVFPCDVDTHWRLHVLLFPLLDTQKSGTQEFLHLSQRFTPFLVFCPMLGRFFFCHRLRTAERSHLNSYVLHAIITGATSRRAFFSSAARAKRNEACPSSPGTHTHIPVCSACLLIDKEIILSF